MRRVLLRSWIALLGLVAQPALASAQDVSVRAYLNPQGAVAVGRTFLLNVEISGAQDLRQEPALPDLGSWAQYLGSSTRSSMRVVNGRSSVSLTLEYRYQAVTEGAYRIPPIDVRVGDRTLTTEPLQISVQAGGQGATPGAGGARDATGISPEDLFITAEATKRSVREGEPLVVEYRIWTRVDVSSFSLTRVPEPEGFWVEDLTPEGQPVVERRSRDGQSYTTAVIRRVALVPTGPGERTIDPIGVEAQVRVQRSDSFGDPFGGFFGRSSLLGSSLVLTTVLSEAVTLDVEALPAGRPEPFSGVVGSLEIEADLDRDSVATGEAVTITLTLRAEGNLSAVPEPDLRLPGDFEVFPPEVSETVRPFGPGVSGVKTFEYVAIPRAPGSRELGPFTMGYFDTESGNYDIARSEPLSLTVSGSTPADGPPLLARGGVDQLREDIRYIHLGAAVLRPSGHTLVRLPSFWLIALLPLALVAGSVAVRRHRERLEGDVAYARGRRAGRVARKRLGEARKLSGGADPRAFYAEVAHALRGLVADRLNLAEAGLQAGELERRLQERGVGTETLEELRSCLAECDRQRFAPVGAASEERSRFLARASDLMGDLDKALR